MFQTNVAEGIKTHILCSITFFENCDVCEKMWRDIVEWGRPLMAIWRMRIACWITKASNTQTGCVILYAFPLQQWLHARASMLRLLLLLTVNGFIPSGSVLQCKTGQYNLVQYNTVRYNDTHHTE